MPPSFRSALTLIPSSFLFVSFGCLTVQGLEADLRQLVTDPATHAVSMMVKGKTCWTCVPQSSEGKPYFHPLAIPGTEDILTSFRPPDHAWHLGLWFSWKFINGVNFWEPGTNGVTRVVSYSVTTDKNNVFLSEGTLAYSIQNQEVVHEERRVSVTTQPNGNYTIAWDSTFTAGDKKAVFSSTPVKRDASGNWASGGYAGLMWRFADSPAFTYAFTNAEGLADVKTCGAKSAWLSVVATATVSGEKATITFHDHPENPRYPTPWFARHSSSAHKGRGYYLVGPSLVFHEPFTLMPNTSSRFRYTVTVERI